MTALDMERRVAELERELKTVRGVADVMPRPMRMASTFEFTCICGRKISTQAVESKCPGCGRMAQVSWPGTGEGV